MTNKVRTSVSPDGNFIVGVHQPSFSTRNLRKGDSRGILGRLPEGQEVDNERNFPQDDITEKQGKWIYEIPNAFPFRGVTYIDSKWAASHARNPESMGLPARKQCSLRHILTGHLSPEKTDQLIATLPQALLYTLAAESTDPEELVILARSCARFVDDQQGRPLGLCFVQGDDEKIRPDIDDFELFETIANNYFLPDNYKEVMVLRPGVQGNSEIVGAYQKDSTNVFEYLRRNSYIPHGHYAANMANDTVRYRVEDLSLQDMVGLRHLYYQRIMVILADQLRFPEQFAKQSLTAKELEELRLRIITASPPLPEHWATLWGWNFGYNISGSGYRLHASHQMIHQQYAMVPEVVARVGDDAEGAVMDSYCCGDQVADTVQRYGRENGTDFFTDYLSCIRNNHRLDTPERAGSLTVWEDDNVMLFVPKAQVSQWELQIIVLGDHGGEPVGNIVEADVAVRRSLDTAIFLAQKILAALGARMVTSLEYSKRMGVHNGQRLLYSLQPKLPWGMGAFSEAQGRYISGHFPEDFAVTCVKKLEKVLQNENLSI